MAVSPVSTVELVVIDSEPCCCAAISNDDAAVCSTAISRDWRRGQICRVDGGVDRVGCQVLGMLCIK